MPSRVGFRPRAFALAIDTSAVLLLSLLFGPWLGFRLGLDTYGGLGPGAGGMMAATKGGTMLIGLLYFGSEGLTGATPGKHLLRLRIGTRAGHEATRGRYLRRWALKNAPSLAALLAVVVSVALPNIGEWIALLSNAAGVVVIAGCFLALRDDRLALHDRLAGTAVYRRHELRPRDEEPLEHEAYADDE